MELEGELQRRVSTTCGRISERGIGSVRVGRMHPSAMQTCRQGAIHKFRREGGAEVHRRLSAVELGGGAVVPEGVEVRLPGGAEEVA